MIRYLSKFIFRNVIFPISYAFGLQHLQFQSKKYLVLNYHGVIKQANLKYNGRHFPMKVFERHLRYFKKHFEILSLSEIFDRYQKGIPAQQPTVALTFDDGFENNFTVVAPLLEKYQIPATFFVTGICADDERAILWPEVINILVQKSPIPLIINGEQFYRRGQYDLYSPKLSIGISDYLKQFGTSERLRILDQLKRDVQWDIILNNTEKDIWKMMNASQIHELAQISLFEVGAHGYWHHNLGNLNEEEAYEELIKSKQILEKITEKPIISIAYPDGSYSKKVKEMSLQVGFKHLLAVTYQVPGDIEDKTILSRYGLSATTNYYSNIYFLHKAFKTLGF